jgi:hypothetical protein
MTTTIELVLLLAAALVAGCRATAGSASIGRRGAAFSNPVVRVAGVVAAAGQFVTAREHRGVDVFHEHLNRVGAHRVRPGQRTPHLCLEPLEPVILVSEDRVGLPRNLD